MILHEADWRREKAYLFLYAAIALDRYFDIHKIMNLPDINDCAAATVLSSVVLETLSLEHALKSIYLYENRERLKSGKHDLQRIFQKIKPTTREELVGLVNKEVPTTETALLVILERHRDLNTIARYNDSGKEFSVSSQDRKVIRLLIRSAISVAKSLSTESP